MGTILRKGFAQAQVHTEFIAQEPKEVELELAQFFAIHFHFWTMWVKSEGLGMYAHILFHLSMMKVVWILFS